MYADRRPRLRGQALVELLVALVALVPLYFGVIWLAKVIDLRQSTIAAARTLAFECTVRPDACTDGAPDPVLAAETRRRFFSAHRFGIASNEAAAGAVSGETGRASWSDRDGRPLLERFEDVSVAVGREGFDSPLAFAGSAGERVFPGAVRVLSGLGGPGRFGLDLQGGFVSATVQAQVSASRPSDGWVARLRAVPLTLRARLAVLTDPWNGSGPYGPEPDTVETRVAAGAALPVIEPAIDAGWLAVRGLLAIADALGLESAAGALRWHDTDVDRVPPDRLPAGGAATPAPPARFEADRP
jgi:hypothetical protein